MTFDHILRTEADLREVVPEPLPKAWAKEIDHLDAHCREFIARSPFFAFGTSALDGSVDVTPRGGPPGFVQVLDDRRLAFADYTGNRRADSHRNLVANPRCHLLFLLPGMGETLRVDGRGVLTTDPRLLAALPTGGKPPRLAVGIEVERAFVHCAKAFRRSGLWEPERWPELDGMPSAAAMLRDHVDAGATEAEVQAGLDDSYATRLW